MDGITFGNKHSYTDWSLYLTGIEISAPEPKRYTVDVPGADGLIDVTAGLTSRPKYYNREIKYTFQWEDKNLTFENKLANIMGYVHGQNLHVVEDTTPLYYWDGFCTVDSVAFEGNIATAVVKVDAKPYRLKSSNTVKTITGSGTLNCSNGRMPVTPSITVTASTTIVFGTKTWTVAAGTHTLSDLIFDEGDNELTITTDGTVTVTYREGSL